MLRCWMEDWLKVLKWYCITALYLARRTRMRPLTIVKTKENLIWFGLLWKCEFRTLVQTIFQVRFQASSLGENKVQTS